MALESTQLLIGVVVILTTLITFVGAQFFLALSDIRKTLGKANKVLDETDEILEDVGLPIKNFSSSFHGLATMGKITAFLLGDKKGKKITKEFSARGKQALARVEELVDEIEENGEYEDYNLSGNGNGKTVVIDNQDQVRLSSPISSFGRRFFKGIPKKR